MTDDCSRYRECIVYQDGELQFFGARQRLDATPQPDDRFHLVVDGDRVDLVAYQYLGDRSLSGQPVPVVAVRHEFQSAQTMVIGQIPG